MQILISIVISLFGFLPFSVHADEVNAGFVQGLWYSHEKVFVDTPTRIYVAFRNNTQHDLTGTVRFSIDGTHIGSSEVRALSGRLVEAWVDWKPTFGTHAVVATVSGAELHIIGGGTEQVDITGMIAEDSLNVDYDTDGDGVANEWDDDDDNDKVSDVDEQARGSNPLVVNPAITDDMEEKEIPIAVEEKASAPTVLTSESGLERYLEDGIVDDVLTSVTERIESTKQTVDAYRGKRNSELSQEKEILTAELSTPNQSGDTATITRNRIEPNKTFLESFISHVATLLSKTWTFLLWLFSFIFAFPSILEVLILIGILYFIYKTAQRLGGRPRRS